MKQILELLEQYYEEFKGLPSYDPIVRNGQKNDAFEVVVLSILYAKELGLIFNKSYAPDIARYIIAPPDGGIDIFIEKASGDDYSYDVIQVKNAPLQEKELRDAILGMKRTIEDYCTNPKLIDSKSCREILSRSNLDKNLKNSCQYYVVHTGKTTDFSGSKENEHIITIKQLEILLNNTSDKVDSETLNIDKTNNFVLYGEAGTSQRAVICSIRGYDLAELNNQYYSTEIGRNILFGQNLREQLNSKKSKTYSGMKNTIESCPENFWYYNNGITIIAEDVEVDDGEQTKVRLRNFSIVNGAQTTSSLGLFLKEAQSNKEYEKIENLKRVFVLARILQISDDDMRRDIAIFNNTQNPITSRDMVANREEQKRLASWLIDECYPQIYVEIRRGSQVPSSFNKGIVHRRTTNEELAQLAYAAFYQQPFTSKDKKSALFNIDYSKSEYTLNVIYHNVFHFDPSNKDKCGVLFRKTKLEIDEALFIQYLYKLGRKYLKDLYQSRIENEEKKKADLSDQNEIDKCNTRIADYSSILETVGVCMFYYIALVYEFKAQFDNKIQKFNTDMFYTDKNFNESLVKESANLFLTLTIRILKKTASDANKSGNINNWVRSSSCQDKFFEALRDEIAMDIELQQKYETFINKYKIDIK